MSNQNLIVFRKTLHQYPEKSGEEKETARRIQAAVVKCQPTTLWTNIGGHGILAIFDSGRTGKTVLFRADMDALPIEEINDFSYKSKNEGVSHKCGHDGHSTILLGLAQKLRNQPLKKGKTILLFQPAEETGEGAKAVLSSKEFASLKIDYAFALHNVPSFPKGQIIYRKGAFNPAVISLIIQFQGLKTHAAEQEHGINPAYAIAQLISIIQTLNNTDLSSPDFCNITIIYTRIGRKDYGTAAGDGELHYTIRCWTKAKLEATKKAILARIATACEREQLTYTTQWLHYFAATANDDFAVTCIENAAKRLNFDYFQKPFPFKWGEDFGLFTEYISGAMFGLGAGLETPALHQSNYDFPDDIISNGIDMFYDIALQLNNEGKEG